MKKYLLFTFTLLLFIITDLSAQVNVQIIVQTPTPSSLSSWKTLPNVIQLIITNTTPNPYSNCIISIQVKNQNGTVVAKTKDWEWSKMPKFTIPGVPNVLMVNAPQLINNDVLWVDPQIQTTVTTTNTLPEGDYDFCVKIFDPYNNQLVNGGEKCQNISITLIEPPHLTMPEDQQLLVNTFPQFFWTPVNLPPYYVDVKYRLKIAKIYASQSPKDAINTNPAVLDKLIYGNSYQYLPSDFDLNSYTGEKGYAWQVQLYNGNAPLAIVGNEGKSEVWSFLPPVSDPTTLKLITPVNGSDFSPFNGLYKFEWDASKQKKSISGFILKIVEVNQGQTPETAMQSNQPVFYKDNIFQNLNHFYIQEEQNVFYDNVQYAWKMNTVSNAWGGIIDESEIRSFTARTNFVETLTAEKPLDNNVYPMDTISPGGFLFKWNRSKVTKSITEYKLIIVPVDSGQTASQATRDNTPVLEKTMNGQTTYYRIYPNQAVLENLKKYAWIVIATSSSYGNKVVAKTEPQLFSVTGAPNLAENVEYFYLNKTKIKVISTSNQNIDMYSGKGETSLWNGGPAFNVDFSNLKIRYVKVSGGDYRWKVIEGQIWSNITPVDIPLTINNAANPSLTAKVRISTFRATQSNTSVYGVVKITTPFLKYENNSTSALVLETSGDQISVDPVTKLNLDTIYFRKVLPEYNMIQPYGYKYQLSSFSRLQITNNKLNMYLDGSITLPDKYKDRDGKKMEFIFKSAPGFVFDVDQTGQATYYHLTNNNDLLMHIKNVKVDMYNAIVKVTDGEMNFNWQKFGLSPIPFNVNQGVEFKTSGFNSNVYMTNLNQNVTYRGYQLNVKKVRIKIINDVYSGQNYLQGEILVPFINQLASITLSINQNGAQGGEVTASFIQNWITLQKANEGAVELKSKIVSMAYFSYDNTFCFNAYFKFTCQGKKGLQTDQMAVSNVSIDSLGRLSIYGTDGNGWLQLPLAKTGNFNGFPITLTKFKIAQYQSAYNFSVGGKIVLSDNLSDAGGSDFAAGVDMPKGTQPGGMPPPMATLQSEPTSVAFGNGQSDFAGSVSYFENDPVFGNGFMATMSVMLHNPGDFGASSKILIGKTDNGNGFSYWYLQAQATLPAPGISTGILSISVRSFEGRIYSHMRHSGTGIMSDDYVPDSGADFGIYGNLGIETADNDGKTLWGNVALEVVIGPGFTSTLAGHLEILTSGWGNSDGMIKGNALITVSTSPKLFDANFDVSVNLKGALCAQGWMKMHIDENSWFLRVGTKENPITASLLCSSSGYHGYFNIEQNYTAFGMGYNFDTGYQEWGEGIGCWGRAWGGIEGDARIDYSPLQFTGTASLNGAAKIGVFVNIKVYKGRLTLLEGAASANMTIAFPDPVCFAGSVHAEGCIDPCPVFSCDICFGATLKVRYKNGSFALKDNCN